jgi:hypothetical protein
VVAKQELIMKDEQKGLGSVAGASNWEAEIGIVA